MKAPAPIALFVYNRPEHSRKCLEALEKNSLSKESILHIFSDGPKYNATEKELRAISEVRKLITEKQWCRQTVVHTSESNRGLAASLISGITELMTTSEAVIVLEDDIVTSPDFLQFCNEGLEKYEQDERVWQISGYMFPLRSKVPETFFLPTVACWGWATWKRAWERYEPNPEILMKSIQAGKLEDRFNLNGSYPYLPMLQDRINGRNQSWAICWYATVFLHEGLSLYPGVTRSVNIGMDESGTHWKGGGIQEHLPATAAVTHFHFPPSVQPNLNIQQKLESSLRIKYHPGWMYRILRKFRSLIRF